MSDTEKTRLLPVEMTQEERATKALQLATACQDIAVAEERMKEAAAEAKSKIKILESDRDALAGEVRTGKEYRAVDVYKRMNLSLRTWEIRRADTLEIVESKAMTEYEYRDATQVKLPFQGGGQRVPSPTAVLAQARAEGEHDPENGEARVGGMRVLPTDQPGGQEIPSPKPAKPLMATVGELAGESAPCVNPNCAAPITNKAQARAGRCGACANYFRLKGVERHSGARVVDKSVRAES